MSRVFVLPTPYWSNGESSYADTRSRTEGPGKGRASLATPRLASESSKWESAQSSSRSRLLASRRARRVPVSEPSRQSDTQALFRRAPVDQLELLPGPMRNVPRHAGPRSACAPRYPRILDLTQWPMAMRGRAPPPPRRRGPNNVLIIPQLSQETRPYNSQLLV